MASIPHRVHLIGIGGMHMSAIARVLLSCGHSVSGSDLTRSPLTDSLETLGVRVAIGPHTVANLGDAAFVVTTSAAPSSNPELEEARGRGLPLLKRADMVALLMEGKIGVCIAGCHGKSTTSGMVAFILQHAGLDPTFLVGAEIADLGHNAAPGSGPHVVVEADEYDRAFLSYKPQNAVVTNVEPDHLDYYGTWEALQEAFAGFAARVQPGGHLLLGAGSEAALALRPHAAGGVNVETFDPYLPADWRLAQHRIDETGQSFQVLHGADNLGQFSTRLPGNHNLANALAAVALCFGLGLSSGQTAAGLAVYHGVRRRFEEVGQASGVSVMDDYAHHPTEIAALAEAARSRFAGRRLVVCFQPHTFARTRYLLDGFRTCFAGFDALILLETYAARETIADGMTAEQLAAEVSVPTPLYAPDAESAADLAAGLLQPGDVFFTAGAGDVDAVGRLLLTLLGQSKRAARSSQ